MLDLLVPETITPMPIKDYLRRYIGLSLTILRKVKHSGIILQNGQPIPITHIISPGDTISVKWLQKCDITPTQLPLDICYEDEFLLIIDKPAGMLVHPTTSERLTTVANAVMHYFHTQNLPYKFLFSYY